jgi:hypothetical protein
MTRQAEGDRDMPDTFVRPGARRDGSRATIIAFVVLLAVAILLRCDTFGDPNLHGDEVFYQTVGIAMHHGALPYVDVWDRKPFGLFALYYLIAALSAAPLAYQIVATLFAAGTAWAIAAIAATLRARDVTDGEAADRAEGLWSGGLFAGICYLLWLAPMQGFGGQSPVFYNLFVALAVLLVLRALPRLREGRLPAGAALAMLLAGIGITIKTTALFEGLFLGLVCTFALWRSSAPRGRVAEWLLLLAALGAAPSLAIAAAYGANGHWPEFWHAMVTSNIAKQPDPRTALVRLGLVMAILTPFLVLAALGLRRMAPDGRRFTLLWLAAAFAGLCAVPNFYIHYAMPLLVPLSVAAAAFLAGRGRIWTAVIAAMACVVAPPFDFAHTRASRAAMAELARTTRAHLGGGGLLTYEGPSQLYRLTGQPFASPLVFPTHFSHAIERDVSHLSTLGEMKRVLATRPGAVVVAEPIRNGPINEQTHQLVLEYVGRHCRLIKAIPVLERLSTNMLVVWGDCRR